jgi:predicted lipid-binding transport protein (Tim44 family)
MNSPIIQLLVLAGIAIFLILKLRNVLGPGDQQRRGRRPELEVIEGGPDRDITDHVPDGSEPARALAAMKAAEPSFNLTEFLKGARGAYEMILMAYERGDIASVKPFLSPEVYDAFAGVIAEREQKGLKVEATFVGISEVAVSDAAFDRQSREGEVTVRFVCEMTYAVRDRAGDIVEGSTTAIKRQRDVWTFARTMGAQDPNWLLVATGD